MARFALALALCLFVAVDATSLRSAIRKSTATLKMAMALPKNVTKVQKEDIIKALTMQEQAIEKNEVAIKKMDKEQKKDEKKKEQLEKAMKPADKEMFEKFDQWDHRMNQKSQVGALDVMSKLKGAIHFIKKGALDGNAKAEEGLNDVLKSMAAYTGGKSG